VFPGRHVEHDTHPVAVSIYDIAFIQRVHTFIPFPRVVVPMPTYTVIHSIT
jgi:predicted ATP-dependent Lon-type protease